MEKFRVYGSGFWVESLDLRVEGWWRVEGEGFDVEG